MYQIAKEFHFSASHIIEGLPKDHKCGRLHGHNYRVVLYLVSEELNEVGFVIDFGVLASFKRWINDYLDHQHLNDVDFFNAGMGIPTTAEAIAKLLFDVAVVDFGPIVAKVRVWETDKAWGEYSL